MAPPSHPPKFTKPTIFARPDGSTFTVASVPGLLGLGLTGIVLRQGNNALKIPRVQVTGGLSDEARYHAEFCNEMNIEQTENEKRIYERLGDHAGVVPCLKLSADGIEMAHMKNGSLDRYLRNHPPVADALKADWLRSLADTLHYIHGRGVCVNDIALRNILVHDDLSLHFADFDNSSLVPLDFDTPKLPAHERSASSSPPLTTTASTDEADDSAVHMDIFHLGFAVYSIVVWKKNEYSLYQPDATDVPSDESSNKGLVPKWPSFRDLPDTESALCGDVILKCWMREYQSVQDVRNELHVALSKSKLAETSDSADLTLTG